MGLTNVATEMGVGPMSPPAGPAEALRETSRASAVRRAWPAVPFPLLLILDSPGDAQASSSWRRRRGRPGKARRREERSPAPFPGPCNLELFAPAGIPRAGLAFSARLR